MKDQVIIFDTTLRDGDHDHGYCGAAQQGGGGRKCLCTLGRHPSGRRVEKPDDI